MIELERIIVKGLRVYKIVDSNNLIEFCSVLVIVIGNLVRKGC